MNFSNLNLAALAKGVLVAFLSGIVAAVAGSINAEHLPTIVEWLVAAKVAGLAAVAYLVKSVFTKPEDNYSKFFSINWRDAGKAVLMLFISTFFAGVTAAINSGHFPDLAQIKTSALAGVTIALGYIIKNIFSNSDGAPLKKE